MKNSDAPHLRRYPNCNARKMKALLRIFELSNNEQRVVLIVIFALVAIAFASYERRVHRHPVERTLAVESKTSPTPAQNEDER